MLAGCDSGQPVSDPENPRTAGSESQQSTAPAAVATPAGRLDLRCDDAAVYSAAWMECEARSYSLIRKGLEESLANPTLQRASLEQAARQSGDFLLQVLDDPSRLNTLLSPSSLAMLAVMGDPFRHPQSAGPNGRRFYEEEAEVQPVLFFDRTCARLQGQVWQPRSRLPGQTLPAVVINNGSVIGTQHMYFWAAQALVRAGYMVMTFDHRSQGRSDAIAPDGSVGSNLDPSVFWLNLVDAIDFLRSGPSRPHPLQQRCAGTSATTAFNPFHATLDPDRLGAVGHSFGAAGVTFAQSYGAPGADHWPGLLDTENPIKAIVAWDALGHPNSPINANGGALFRSLGNLAGPTYNLTGTAYPAIVPRVPALDLPTDFGALSAPHLLGEQKDHFMPAFKLWRTSGLSTMVVVPHASTHTQYSQNPFIPASSWCGDPSVEACNTGWVIPMATHYTVAWFDRWLKQAGEPGYRTADSRLLDNGNSLTGAVNMSWHYLSARHLVDRSGQLHECLDLRRC
ncbi:MAG TPA: hypothetical protein VFV28_11045 [Limnobacter sp.]|nr:hypothetical protein [Limnobacter sp.]